MAAAFFMVCSYEYTWIFPDPTGEYDCSFGVDKYAWIYHRSLWSSRLPIQYAWIFPNPTAELKIVATAMTVCRVKCLQVVFFSKKVCVFLHNKGNVPIKKWKFKMACLLILLINRQKGHMSLWQFCSAQKTLKSKRQWVNEWVSDKVTYWAVLDS